MSTVIARRIASTPARTASGTWEKIVQILAPGHDSEARRELTSVSGVASVAISSEAVKDTPIVVWGGGPRVRVYGIFGEDSLTGDDVNEDALGQSPTQGDWKMSIPCQPEDVAWSKEKLATVSTRITARSSEEDVEDDDRASASSVRRMPINLKEFLKP
jgi:hypothetical protein